MTAMSFRTSRIYYGWIIVSLGFVTLFFCTATLYSFGIFFRHVLGDLGGSRAALSGAYGLGMIVYGIMQLIVGRLFNRYGARPIISVGVAMIGVAAILNSLSTAVWHLYLSFGVLLAGGIGLAGVTPMSIVTTRWFTARLGSALSVMSTGFGAGLMVMFPVISRLISVSGWRPTYQILGAFLLLVILPLNLLFMRESPEAIGLEVDGGLPREGASDASPAAGAPDPADEPRVSVLSALRTYAYPMICFSYFVCGFSESMLLNHLPIFAVDQGVSRLVADSALSVMSFIALPAVIIAGQVSDRIGRRAPLSLAYLVRTAGLLTIVFSTTPGALYLGSFLFGIGFMATIPLITAMVSDLFGKRSHAVLFAFVGFIHQIGAMAGPVFAASLFDAWRTYLPAFWVGILVAAISTVGIYLIRERPRLKPA